MSSSWPSALKSLDDSSSLLTECLEKLTAAKSVDLAEIIKQLQTAAESARIVRESISSELPEASWQNREELETVIEKVQLSLKARALEQLRSRLLALATELEHGSIVHRRALRVNELNQLRERAISELRSQAALEATPNLPGPEADRWIEWACGLKEPQDAEALQTLRNFAHLDDFVANLEPNMWIAAASPALETLTKPEGSAVTTLEEPHRLETHKSEESQRVPELVNELPPPALESNAPKANDVTAAQSEEQLQRTIARERALLKSMMGFDIGEDQQFNGERPNIEEVVDETFVGPAIASDSKSEVEKPGKRKWWPLAVAAFLVFAALGAILWRSHRNNAISRSVEASERRVPEPAQSNPVDQNYHPAGLSTDSQTPTSSPTTQAQAQSKPQDQKIAPSPASTAAPTKQANKLHDAVLQPPPAVPRNSAKVSEDTPPNGTAEIAGLAPGVLPNGGSNGAANIVADIPVAVPRMGAKVKVSSGVAQGLLIHQVKPQYPPLARQMQVQGTVVFQAVIGKDGSVQSLHVLKGNPLLIQAATDAVKKWRYKPYSLNGEPVEANTEINVHFALGGG